jgi:hypothetical protein
MANYSYEKCLERSYRVNWRIEEVLDGHQFDPNRDWLPQALSGASTLEFLSHDERRQLTHVEMAAYAHLFGYAEEFVAPTFVELADEVDASDRNAFHALTNFAGEEVKHMTLFRTVRDLINEHAGFTLDMLGRQEETVRYVMGKNRGAVLLLASCIEWFTQRHYRECFQDATELDAFTRHIFKCHWLEESQHAQLDHLETVRTFEAMPSDETDTAIDDLIALVGTVDGWLVEQAGHDVRNFERYAGRTLTKSEEKRVFDAVLEAKRYTFLITGVTHPRFMELFAEVATPDQQERVNAALIAMLPVLAEGAEAA